MLKLRRIVYYGTSLAAVGPPAGGVSRSTVEAQPAKFCRLPKQSFMGKEKTSLQRYELSYLTVCA